MINLTFIDLTIILLSIVFIFTSVMSLFAPELEGSEKIVIVVILLCLYVMGLISAIDLKQDLKTKAVEIEVEIKKYTEKMETGEEKNKGDYTSR